MDTSSKKLATLWHAIDRVTKAHYKRHALRDKEVSAKTAKERRNSLRRIAADLHCLGYALEHPKNLSRRHIAALADDWIARGLSPGRIANLLSALRWLGRILPKPGFVPELGELFADERAYRRRYVASEDKSWEAAGVDYVDVVRKLYAKDPPVAVQLLLIIAFGLRALEAQRLRPHQADYGDRLAVFWGAKNGRKRFEPIDTPAQREVLELAKSYAPYDAASTIPAHYKADAWYWHFYYILSHYGGVTRKQLGVTVHGLRHEYLGDLYETLTGLPRPLRGPVDATPENLVLDRKGRKRVADIAGHRRPGITAHYVGGNLVERAVQQKRCATARKKYR